MTFQERVKLAEASKARFIDKNENLTSEQKEEVKKFFNQHPDQDNKIDWNKSNSLQYEDFFNVISKFNERFLPKLTINDLEEGKDYVALGSSQHYDYYFIKTYKASVAFASNNIGQEIWSPLCSWYKNNDATGESTNWEDNVIYDYPQKLDSNGKVEYGGAKWCISLNHTDRFWKEYTKDGKNLFIFAIGNEQSPKGFHKIAMIIKLAEDNIFISATTKEKPNKRVIISNCFIENDTLLYYAFSDMESEIKGHVSLYNDTIYDIALSIRKEIEDIKAEEEKEIIEYLDNAPLLNFFLGEQFFLLYKVGTRAEGDVYINYFVTNFKVRFSYCSVSYPHGCNRWDKSILRQWLNSDKPKGEWCNFEESIGEPVIRDKELIDFINNTDGFLKMIDISKSQLVPVRNKTCYYEESTREYKYIETEDYVWIPSLTELSTKSSYQEGEPLEFFKLALGNNASPYEHLENRKLNKSDISVGYVTYFTRTIYDPEDYNTKINFIMDGACSDASVDHLKLPVCVLMCFANSNN